MRLRITLLVAVLAGYILPASPRTVSPPVSPRATICLNGVWETAPGTDQVEIPQAGWTKARVPASPVPESAITAQWYRLRLEAPPSWAAENRHYWLEIEKAGHYAAVFCNGRKLGEHYGQYTPFSVDLTGAFQVGRQNELAIYVHNASGVFACPGANVTNAMLGNAYRPAAETTERRNWVGLMGDISLWFRPGNAVSDVFVLTSVRQKKIEAQIRLPAELSARATNLICEAAVLDGDKEILPLGSQPLASGATNVVLGSAWSDPVLWGSGSYGTAKLYTVRVDVRADAKLLDRSFTRFGFREIWIDGRRLVLNGKRLWMVGTYHSKMMALRCLNDRRAMNATVWLMQASGLNSFHGHWDDLGRNWLDACDENGMFVLGGFYCDGRPKIQSQGDAQWVSWMTATCAEWVEARRKHPSILLWRPIDVLPPHAADTMPYEKVQGEIGRQARVHDPSHRPLADGSSAAEVVTWGQAALNPETRQFDNFGPLEDAAWRNKAFLCKEIYCGFNLAPELLQFFETYYSKSLQLKSSGFIVQCLPLQNWGEAHPYTVQWLSLSGSGNREQPTNRLFGETANWCDPEHPASKPSAFSPAFAQWYTQLAKNQLAPCPAGNSRDVLVSGLAPGSVGWLAPAEGGTDEPQGVLAAPDGTAWFLAPRPGKWRLLHHRGEEAIEVPPLTAIPKPGYGHVVRVVIK